MLGREEEKEGGGGGREISRRRRRREQLMKSWREGGRKECFSLMPPSLLWRHPPSLPLITSSSICVIQKSPPLEIQMYLKLGRRGRGEEEKEGDSTSSVSWVEELRCGQNFWRQCRLRNRQRQGSQKKIGWIKHILMPNFQFSNFLNQENLVTPWTEDIERFDYFGSGRN